jgi:hypothetical protein
MFLNDGTHFASKIETLFTSKEKERKKKKHAVGKASTFNLCEVIFCGHLNNKLIKVQS